MGAQIYSSKVARFEAFLAPHRDILQGYEHRLVGHPTDAQDLQQDIALKAFEWLDTLRVHAA